MLLLDTHTLLWWHAKSKALSKTVLSTIENSGNEVFVSLVSIWEIQIKAQLGRLTLHEPVATLISQEVTINGFQILPVKLEHIFGLDALALHHNDPFDRLLIAQARQPRQADPGV